jgi:hypothetical protein
MDFAHVAGGNRLQLKIIDCLADRTLLHGDLHQHRHDRFLGNQPIKLPPQILEVVGAKFLRLDQPGLAVTVDDQVGIRHAVEIDEEGIIAGDEDIDQPLPLSVLPGFAKGAPLRGVSREVDNVVVVQAIASVTAGTYAGGHPSHPSNGPAVASDDGSGTPLGALKARDFSERSRPVFGWR